VTDVPAGRVEVTRSGGFAGLTVRGEVDLERLEEPERSVWEWALRDGLPGLAAHEPAPDRFVYRVSSAASGLDVTVGEHELPEDLRTLLERAVRPGP
jgi:emfourin